MAHIKKRGRKYRVCWTDVDGRETNRTCPDKATANKLELDVERARALGLRWRPPDERPPPSIDDIFAAYVERNARVLSAGTSECERSS